MCDLMYLQMLFQDFNEFILTYLSKLTVLENLGFLASAL